MLEQHNMQRLETRHETQWRIVPRSTARPQVVIIGAGFGGLSAARALAHSEVDVLVLDRNNYHGFWPLLYQVATAGLEPEAIAYPARAILRKYANIHFQMAEVRNIDFQQKLVYADDMAIPYDYLILAAGSANNYFGNDALADQTFSLKDIEDAERLRNHLLTVFERSVRELDPARRKTLLTLMIVGGGPTGVELAGAFAELFNHVLRQDYPELNIAEARVVLVEGTDRVLPSFAPSLQRKARQRLERMGVEVRLNTLVTNVEGSRVIFKDGTSMSASTVVWTAGVRAASLADVLGVPQSRGARIQVEPTLTLKDQPEVFVIGDMAYLEGYRGNQSYPMLAPVAMQQGERAAQNIRAQVWGQPMQAFRYNDRGQMATIGRRSAVLEAFGIRLTGFLAWLGWLFVHIIELIGFRNRLIVLTNWAYNYFTYDRGVRLITRREEC